MDNNKNTEQEEKSETKKSVHLDSDPELISLLRKASKSCDCSQNHDIILRYKTNDNQEFFADVKPFLKSQDIVDTPCIDKMVTKHKRVIQHTRLRPYLECDYMIAPTLGDNPMEIAYKTTRRHDFSFPKPTRQFWYFQREPVTVGVVLCRTKCPNCRTIICPPDTCCPVCNPPPKRPVCTRKPMLCSHPPKKCCKCPQSCPPKDCPPMPPCCYQPLPACCSKMSSACCRDICLQTDCATSCRACAAKKTCRVPCFNKPACPDAYCDNKPMCHTRSGCSMRFQCAPRSKCNLHVPSCGSNAVIVCEAPPWPQRSCAAPSRCDICRAFAPCDRKPSCDSFAKYVCASSHCYDVRCESSSSKVRKLRNASVQYDEACVAGELEKQLARSVANLLDNLNRSPPTRSRLINNQTRDYECIARTINNNNIFAKTNRSTLTEHSTYTSQSQTHKEPFETSEDNPSLSFETCCSGANSFNSHSHSFEDEQDFLCTGKAILSKGVELMEQCALDFKKLLASSLGFDQCNSEQTQCPDACSSSS